MHLCHEIPCLVHLVSTLTVILSLRIECLAVIVVCATVMNCGVTCVLIIHLCFDSVD